MFRILNLEPEGYSQQALEILQTIGTIDNLALDRKRLLKSINSYDILITRLEHRIDAEVLDAAKNLKIIVTATTGLNHIDVKEAEKRGIAVLSLKGETEFLNGVHATAEHTMALILALARNLKPAADHAASGQWNRDLFKGFELSGKTLGIVGYGRLGLKVAGYARAFDMNILACDAKALEVPLVPLDDLLRQSDIVSLHASYFPSTRGFINKEKISLIKPGAILINTARGELIDEAALLNALKSGAISAAALDVLTGENSGRKDWAKTDPLIAYAAKNPNLIITPHIGGATKESMEKTEIFMAQKLAAFLKQARLASKAG